MPKPKTRLKALQQLARSLGFQITTHRFESQQGPVMLLHLARESGTPQDQHFAAFSYKGNLFHHRPDEILDAVESFILSLRSYKRNSNAKA